jgi:hypothetical protein
MVFTHAVEELVRLECLTLSSVDSADYYEFGACITGGRRGERLVRHGKSHGGLRDRTKALSLFLIKLRPGYRPFDSGTQVVFCPYCASDRFAGFPNVLIVADALERTEGMFESMAGRRRWNTLTCTLNATHLVILGLWYEFDEPILQGGADA